MNYILFDNFRRNNLLPLTYTRPVADIRIGILSIREKWEAYLETETSTLTESYLRKKFPIRKETNNILINASICPNQELVDRIKSLEENQALLKEEVIIAMRVNENELDKVADGETDAIEEIEYAGEYLKITNTWDVFSKNGKAIEEDFELLTKGRKSAKLSKSNTVIGEENVFVEEGATVECSILNASTGPIYIGKDAEIMENSVVRGPFALCEHAVLKMSSKIYGPTTIGPYSKVGGEVNNAVFFGYSNKAHDGFLGNSVIGEWCNLGADTNNSNLKNTYDEVKLWSYADKTFVPTGLQFCGLIMGDHSKCGINTMFNTGTVVGVNSNVYGPGFQRNFIPSFVWGGTSGFRTYNISKAFEVASAVYRRRNKDFNEVERDIMLEIFNLTYPNRAT